MNNQLPSFLTSRTGSAARYAKLSALQLEEQKYREYKEAASKLSATELRQIPFTEEWMDSVRPAKKSTFTSDHLLSDRYNLDAKESPPTRNGPADTASHSVFKIKTAAQWIKDSSTRPAAKMLCGELWFEGEICILFADTNVGKSILAVQIADAIARGQSIGDLSFESGPQMVIYFDFELSDKQFEARYSTKKDATAEFLENPYQFSENLFRAEIDPGALNETADFESFLYDSLEKTIVSYGAKVLIIDNITFLSNETERAKYALPLMKTLKALKAKYGLSILVLAHTPKRDLSKPITQNDLQGSKMLINFCDSCFAIGKSSSDSIRYLKQIKARNTEIKFDSENVYLCEIQKSDNFLHFEFVGYGTERDHLRDLSDGDRASLIEQAKELSAQGLSQRTIAERIGRSAMTVGRYLRM